MNNFDFHPFPGEVIYAYWVLSPELFEFDSVLQYARAARKA